MANYREINAFNEIYCITFPTTSTFCLLNLDLVSLGKKILKLISLSVNLLNWPDYPKGKETCFPEQDFKNVSKLSQKTLRSECSLQRNWYSYEQDSHSNYQGLLTISE